MEVANDSMMTKALEEPIHNTVSMWTKRSQSILNNYGINDKLNTNYADYSRRYWAGVKERARLHRETRQDKNYGLYYGRF